MPTTIDIDTALPILVLAAAILLGLVIYFIVRDSRPVEHQGWDEDASELDRMVTEYRTGELPTLEPDDTQVLNRRGSRPAATDTLPDWAQTQPVEVPVVVPVADQAVVLTTTGRKRGRHAAGYVEFVDPDWYNAQLGCAQYPRAVNLR